MIFVAHLLVSGLLCGAAVIAHGAGLLWAQTVVAVLQSLVLLSLGYSVSRQFSSLVFVFCMFYVLYGISAPVSVLLGVSLDSIFGDNLPIDRALFIHSMGTLGIVIGIVAGVVSTRRKRQLESRANCSKPVVTLLLGVGYMLALLSSLFELTNLVRAGGTETLALGKALYQSTASDLTLTLPSINCLVAASAFFATGLALRSSTGTTRRSIAVMLVRFLAAGGVTILVASAIGRRGPLIALVLVFGIAWAQIYPIRRVSLRAFTFMLMIYLAMGILYSNRAQIGYGIVTGDMKAVFMPLTDVARLGKALNPATNEFGAPFGNLVVYLYHGDQAPRLGQTYLNGMALLVPGFLYPGSKPSQITYEFRDHYFPEEKLRGSIASTGYSPFVEALMNYRIPGVLAVMTLVGLCVVLLDLLKWGGSCLFLPFYAMMAPLMQLWHRSSFGDTFSYGWMTGFLGLFGLCSVWILSLLLRLGRKKQVIQ